VGGVRILFAGSPAQALPTLKAVAGMATELAVVSQPDKPVGRKKTLTPTPVSAWALEEGITLHRPADREGIAQVVSEVSPDLGITVAYGRLLQAETLAIPPAGWWNVHFSLLPRWRGAAPVQHALLAGDSETGVTVFQLDEGVDTGPVLNHRSYPIPPGITAGKLLDELSDVGAAILAETLQLHLSGALTRTPQSGTPTQAPKLARESGRVRSTDTIDNALRRFQATTPEPGCFVSFGNGEQTLKILAAQAFTTPHATSYGTIQALDNGVGIGLDGGFLLLETVQPAGKKAMPAADWWRGVHEEIHIDG